MKAHLASAPLILPHNQLWYECFCELGSMRPQGFGLCRVPRDKIAWYADDELRFTNEEDRRAFIWIMTFVDFRFVQHEQKKQDKNSKR